MREQVEGAVTIGAENDGLAIGRPRERHAVVFVQGQLSRGQKLLAIRSQVGDEHVALPALSQELQRISVGGCADVCYPAGSPGQSNRVAGILRGLPKL